MDPNQLGPITRRDTIVQRYASDGTWLGSVTVNAAYTLPFSPYQRPWAYHPAVAEDDAGDFVVTTTEDLYTKSGDFVSQSIVANVYDSTGTVLTSLAVSDRPDDPSNTENQSGVAMDKFGNFVVTYLDNGQLSARLFAWSNQPGSSSGDHFAPNGFAADNSVASDTQADGSQVTTDATTTVAAGLDASSAPASEDAVAPIAADQTSPSDYLSYLDGELDTPVVDSLPSVDATNSDQQQTNGVDALPDQTQPSAVEATASFSQVDGSGPVLGNPDDLNRDPVM
jgi:hypothetical protein